MARYLLHAKFVVEIDTPRSPAQIRSALVDQAPTFRDALKDAWRAQMAKDGSGQTTIVEWHSHITGQRVDGEVELDLDDGGPVDEVEP